MLHQLFHQLLFLNKEGPHNSILDTVCTARSTVGTLYCLLILGKTHVFFGTKGRDLAVSTNSEMQNKNVIEFDNSDKERQRFREQEWKKDLNNDKNRKGGGGTPGSVMPQSPHRGPLPGFLMCKYRNFPPGVLMTRVRFERVLSNCK